METAWWQLIRMTSTWSLRCDRYMSDSTGLINIKEMQVTVRERVLQPWWFSGLCLEGVPSPLLSISVLRFHENSYHLYPHCALLFRHLSFFAMSACRRARTLNQGSDDDWRSKIIWVVLSGALKRQGLDLKEGNSQSASFDVDYDYKW